MRGRICRQQRGGIARLPLAALLAVCVAMLLLAVLGSITWFHQRAEDPVLALAQEPPPSGQDLVARGAYLARAGNCMACHTVAGGAPYAGGRAIPTPFGDVYGSNITPHDETGIGRWSASAFWRAMRHGRSLDGRMLYPAFPYPSYSLITREDADALYAYLRSLPPVDQPNRPHDLRFPYDQPAALAVWRALYFRPQVFENDMTATAEWNRGRYLVDGLGHCAACHATRDALGGVRARQALSGGLMPGYK